MEMSKEERDLYRSRHDKTPQYQTISHKWFGKKQKKHTTIKVPIELKKLLEEAKISTRKSLNYLITEAISEYDHTAYDPEIPKDYGHDPPYALSLRLPLDIVIKIDKIKKETKRSYQNIILDAIDVFLYKEIIK